VEPKESNSKKHFWFSIYKSIFRLGAGAALWKTGDTFVMTAGALLIIAEILGILEEL